MNEQWKPITKNEPPDNVKVMTRIDDGRGIRNEQVMFRQGTLWFVGDGGMYVYYAPTHYIEPAK